MSIESPKDLPAARATRQRRLALIMGVMALVAAAFGALVNLFDREPPFGWSIVAVMIFAAAPLLAYWWTGEDPRGYGKPLWGKGRDGAPPRP